jgi:hypothetical protein
MKGDFTRFSHDPKKHFSGVLQQQGRVSVDADWNEYVQIQNYLRLIGNRDIIGRWGVPSGKKDGFLIGRSADKEHLVLQSGDEIPARIYVDGIMCQMENDMVIPNPGKNGTYLAYLDVWQHHITFAEDSEIVEVALGGPDTTTRIKNEWQVRLKELTPEMEKRLIDLKIFCRGEYGWVPEEYNSTGKMAARSERPEEEEKICGVEAKGGYRGLENRLYRIEIQNGGDLGTDSVTFKWSRDNGSVVFPVETIEYKNSKSTVSITQMGKDDLLTLHVGDWVEISDDRDELALKTGILAQVADGSDMSKGIVVLETDVSVYQTPNHPKIRRWDQKDSSEVTLVNGVITISADSWLQLEDGVEVSFKAGTYQVGDYWLIPARTRLRDVLWDLEGENPVYESRHGTEHHFCPLAIVEFGDRVWGEPEDLRHIFYPLNQINQSCCITVQPGENIQRAIDCIIALGGGCVRLCTGVHSVRGPLTLDNAQNVTILSENAATVVHFEGTNEDGVGGFILNGCTGVAVTGMMVIGEEISSLFTLKSGETSRPNLDITLQDLTAFNSTNTKHGEPGSTCVVRVDHARNINIINCRMMAENGIISLFGNSLPDPGLTENPAMVKGIRLDSRIEDDVSAEKREETKLNYGAGVYQLNLKDSTVLFQWYGIWALKSVEWKLDNSYFAVSKEIDLDRQAIRDSRRLYQAVIDYMEKAQFNERPPSQGIAIKALIWKDCRVNDCKLNASTGMNVSMWLGGEVAGSKINAKYGLAALWLHDATWEGNTIKGDDIGMSLVGSFRSRIEGNHVRSNIGLINGSLAKWLGGIKPYLNEMIWAYNIPSVDQNLAYVALWVLLEEACRTLKLDEIRDAYQDLLNTFENLSGIPVLLLVSIYLYPQLDSIAKNSAKIPFPIIALKVKDNEIEAANGICLIDFIPMGGLNIGQNRIQTLKGQAVVVKANPYTVNPNVVIVLWRFLYKVILMIFQRLSDILGSMVEGLELSDERKAAILDMISGVVKVIIRLNGILETILEADYRIESNSIRSHRTAIETNIFEIAIQNNHITIEESEYSNEEAKEIIDILDKYSTTRDIATGMRERSKTHMRVSLDDIGSSKESRDEIQKMSSEIQEKPSRSDLKEEAARLSDSAKAGDTGKVQESISKIIDILESYVDDCGIWIKGAGCRIVGNHVIVPLDAESKTWSQGGIRFWDDEGSPIWFLTLIDALLQIYYPEKEIPSLLTTTETIIDNNEIIRGAAHGVEINGIKNMPFNMGLIDLKIRGNQIQDMAGTGITFDEKSLTIGADIEDNRILDCGNPNLTVIVDKKGGLVIRNTAGCRIQNNRIRCISNLENGVGLFAVDLAKIYGLTMTNNYLQHAEVSNYTLETAETAFGMLATSAVLLNLALVSLCGVVRISELNGEAVIQNNDILLYRGVGTGLVMGSIDLDIGGFWERFVTHAAMRKEPTGLTEAIEVEPGADVPAALSSSSIQGNRFESSTASRFFAFLVAGLQDLNFTGNNVRTKQVNLSPGYILGVMRGVVNSNMLDTLAISMGSGVLTGNVSNVGITPPGGAVICDLNSP